jgi:chemotaxis protein CheX
VLTERFALQAATIMLQQEAGAIAPADVQDAAAELANIVGGSIKSILPGPSTLSLPTVVGGTDYLIRVPRGRLAAAALAMAAGQPTRVRVIEAL